MIRTQSRPQPSNEETDLEVRLGDMGHAAAGQHVSNKRDSRSLEQGFGLKQTMRTGLRGFFLGETK